MSALYCAYPIDQSITNIGRAITQWQIIAMEQGFDVIYDPGDAFSVRTGAQPTSVINKVNGAALAACDAVVAFLPADTPSVGVPREIEQAVALGKPLVVYAARQTWALPHEVAGVRVRTMQDAWDDQVVLQDAAWAHGETERESDLPKDADGVLWFRRTAPAVPGGWDVTPRRAYPDDAGFDLVVSETKVIPAGEFVDIPCGIEVELPGWTWGYLTGRSSTLRKLGLLVNPGVIDCGYRGPLFAGVQNLTNAPVEVLAGTRIAQLIVLPNATASVELVETAELSDHPRGQQGFGSSGK